MPVKTNIGEGANIRKDTATEADVLDGLTFHAGKSQKQRTGTLADKTGTSQAADASLDTDSNLVQMKIPATGKYNTASSLYATYASILAVIGLTADMLKAGVSVLELEGTFSSGGTATEEDILEGKTASVGGEDVVGALADKSGTTTSATASLDTSNSRLRMKIPTTAKYDTSAYLYATYSAIRTLIGLTASVIATGTTILGVEGTYTGLGDASASDVLAGKTFSTASLSGASGTLADKTGTTQEAELSVDSDNSRVQMKIPATGKYNTSSYLYAAYSTIASLIGLTASVIATGTSILGIDGSYKGIGTATAAQVLTGYTFSSASLSGASGSMPNLTSNATITYTSDNSTKVIVGDAAFASTNSDSVNRVSIRYNSSSGYISGNTLFAIAYGTMATAIGLTAAKLGYGKTCLGLTGTYKPTVARIAASAVFGFGNTVTTYLSNSATYTCPASGTCYYDGFAVTYDSKGDITCEIYKNGVLVEDSNIDGDYVQRTTMVGQSVSVASGDVIKIIAEVTKGSSAAYSRASLVTATIVTYG